MIISFINQKGGVGKSTLAFNLAAFCATSKSTVILDLDPQGTISRLLTDSVDESKTSAKIFKGADPNKLIEHTVIHNLDIIKGTLALENEMATRNIATLQSSTDILIKHYDVAIIDTRPSVDTAFISAIKVANVAVVPIMPEVSSLYDLPNMIRLIKSSSTKAITKFVINNMDGRIKSHSIIASTIKSKINIELPIVHSSAAIKNAMMKRQSVFDYDPSSRAARELTLLFKRLLLF